MRLTLTVRAGGPSPVDVVVEIDPAAPVRELQEALLAAVPGGRPGLWAHDRPLLVAAPVGGCGLRDGDVVGLGGPARPRPGATGLVARVAGGPDAGLVLPLRPGGVPIGRSTGLTDPDVSRRHAVLHVGGAAVRVRDDGSTNGTRLDGAELVEEAELAPGAVLRLGDTLLQVGTAERASGITPDGLCGLERSRPPRLLPAPDAVRVELPRPPHEEDSRGFPVLAALAPLVMGVALALVLGPRFLVFALLSPVALVATWLSDRRRGRVSRERRRRDHEAALAEAHARLERARTREGRLRRDAHPDPGAVLLTATGPGPRLWERRPADPDHLEVRLGTATLPSRVELVGAEPATVDDVPVVLPLAAVGVLGLAGPRAATRGVCRSLLAQLAVLQRAQDVRVVVLTDRSAAPDWGWLAFLPHARAGTTVLVGNDSETVAARVAELVALVRGRTTDRASAPAVVVVLDGARALRRLPGVPGLLRDGPGAGVHLVCLDDEEGLLPEECTATVAVAGHRGTVRRTLQPDVADVLLEPVPVAWSGDVARALLPLRDRDEQAEGLPDRARLLDLLGLEALDPARLAARWGRTTTAVLGAGSDGPFHVDLVRDGPHALVAGTTGSGKSELLQSLVASLAVGNSPEAMSFVLVDYKGGSAFRDCARLPHTVGMVTDLDPHLVRRALASLGAELTRREHVLADAGVSDLTALERAGGSLGRLVLVIDEFASLARELPDFVRGLVSIAQRGRSLGLHLVLATQRPTGVVSPEIRANTDLRIALRMTDAAESADVVDVPDAARIPRDLPGRGVVRLGQGVLAPFQTGRVGGVPASAAAALPTSVTRWTWPQLGRQATAPAAPEAEGPTDLAGLVDALVAAAELVAAPVPRTPWLPALPEAVALEDLVPQDGVAGVAGGAAGYGLADLPAHQAQPVATWDPDVDGHLLVVGAPRSGRTQVLLTLAASLALRRSTRDVHLHALDCGGGGLLGLEALPHCGAVVTREQPERVGRLLSRLVEEVARRQSLLSSAGLASVAQARAAGRPIPHVVLLLDRWEGFAPGLGELDGGAMSDQVLALLREGAGVGVHVVATGDRSLLLGRVGATAPERLVLRLADRGDYAAVGLDPRAVPEAMPPGRAVHVPSGAELQVARPTAPLADVAARCSARDADVDRADRPFRVAAVPARVEQAQVCMAGPPLLAALGLGGDEQGLVAVDLGAGAPSLLVAGPARSGRSTSLVALARGFLARGAEVVLGAPRPSPLRLLAGTPGVRAVLTDLTADALTDALDRAGPVVVLLDDAELLRDCPASTLLGRLAAGAPGRALVAAGSPEGLGGGFSGWHVQARQARQGLLLSPRSVADGELVGCRLPRYVLGGPVVPGRGLAHLGDGRVVPVQVPV